MAVEELVRTKDPNITSALARLQNPTLRLRLSEEMLPRRSGTMQLILNLPILLPIKLSGVWPKTVIRRLNAQRALIDMGRYKNIDYPKTLAITLHIPVDPCHGFHHPCHYSEYYDHHFRGDLEAR